MKFTNNYLAIIVALLVVSGCATSGGGFTPESNSSNNSVEVTNESITLAEYLQRIPGVRVTGNGASATITVQGTSSFTMGEGNPSNTNSSPLFVIDGRIIGNNFARAYDLVNMADVASIDVLKGADAAKYGSRGGNGVIEINYE